MPIDQFNTERLSVRNWRPAIDSIQTRQTLETHLSAILSDRVLKYLPPPLQLTHRDRGMSSWIDARAKEARVLLVSWNHNEELIGLLILASDTGAVERPTMHVGYLLAETTWGQGIASELLKGLVAALKTEGPARLIGGVGRDNPASARVLQKAGFVRAPNMSTPETDMFIRDVG